MAALLQHCMLCSLLLCNASQVGSAWQVAFVTLPIPLPVTLQVFRALSWPLGFSTSLQPLTLLCCALVQNSLEAQGATLLPEHCHIVSEGAQVGL